MEQNFDDISLQQVQKLARSPAGRKLMALLQQSDTGQLTQATERFRSGDTAQAQQLLKPLLESAEIAQLLRELGG